jgi:hypothetical protein
MSACRFEPEIIRASEEDRWTEALRRHAETCGDCEAAASVGGWMRQFARVSDREHILPDPSVLWLKARLLQGTSNAARAARPLDLLQMIAYLTVGGGWAALLTWRWDLIEGWLHGITPGTLVQAASRTEALSLSFYAMLFVLASVTVMVALHTILAEE